MRAAKRLPNSRGVVSKGSAFRLPLNPLVRRALPYGRAGCNMHIFVSFYVLF
jgi:hypothetical protein